MRRRGQGISDKSWLRSGLSYLDKYPMYIVYAFYVTDEWLEPLSIRLSPGALQNFQMQTNM